MENKKNVLKDNFIFSFIGFDAIKEVNAEDNAGRPEMSANKNDFGDSRNFDADFSTIQEIIDRQGCDFLLFSIGIHVEKTVEKFGISGNGCENIIHAYKHGVDKYIGNLLK